MLVTLKSLRDDFFYPLFNALFYAAFTVKGCLKPGFGLEFFYGDYAFVASPDFLGGGRLEIPAGFLSGEFPFLFYPGYWLGVLLFADYEVFY